MSATSIANSTTDPRVSEIPLLNERLQAATTPYVVFKHPFVDRPGRLTRQADVMDRYGSTVFHSVGDVWPSWCKYPYRRRLMRNSLKYLPLGEKTNIRLWPETVMYRTKVAQQFEIDETVVYRPHMAFWLDIYETMGEEFIDRCAFAVEAYVDVGDRDCFPHDFKGAPVQLAKANQLLTVVIVAKNNAATFKHSINSLIEQTIGVFEARICDCGSVDETPQLISELVDQDPRFVFAGSHDGTTAGAANKALQQAAGEKIAIWDLSTISRPWRFSEQLKLNADIVGSEYAELGTWRGMQAFQPLPSEMLPYAYTSRSIGAVLPSCTLMFDRRLLSTGAFDAVLSAEWGFAFQAKAVTDRGVSVAKSSRPLVTRLYPAEQEALRYGDYYCKAVRRDVIDHLGRGFSHVWPE